MEDQYILKAQDVTKRFGGLVALDSVRLDVLKGEVHALVGENGAGKSTMMNILSGVFPKDAGSIEYQGESVEFSSPMDAIKQGIAIIHQELSMMPDLNIIENVYMGRMESTFGRIDWKTMAERTRTQLARIGLRLDPFMKVSELPTSHRQMVEIAKAISVDAKLIIMDEPNSSLTESESKRLFEVIRSLQADGIAIIYVSHKLDEVLHISDRITSFRDGKYVGTVNTKDATVKTVIQMMVGRDVEVSSYPREPYGETLLSVRGLSGRGFEDISFDLHQGEILGFSGLVGSGRSEVARALFGADPHTSGSIELEGRAVRFNTPQMAIKSGIAMLAEDRKTQSIFPNLPIWLNMALSQMPRISRKGKIDWKAISSIIDTYTKKFSIKYGKDTNPISSLSGGNQQKVILARWMAVNPSILILDEPTHGVDVGAKADIYSFIHELSKAGLGVLFISSEMPELMALCHRVCVMHEGKITGILDHTELTEERIMTLAAGYQEESI